MERIEIEDQPWQKVSKTPAGSTAGGRRWEWWYVPVTPAMGKV
jgi:hypothetical protein